MFRAFARVTFSLLDKEKVTKEKTTPDRRLSGIHALKVRARWPLVYDCTSLYKRRQADILSASLRALRVHRSPPLRGPNIKRSALLARRSNSTKQRARIRLPAVLNNAYRDIADYFINRKSYGGIYS
jgi:hypothetical protein